MVESLAELEAGSDPTKQLIFYAGEVPIVQGDLAYLGEKVWLNDNCVSFGCLWMLNQAKPGHNFVTLEVNSLQLLKECQTTQDLEDNFGWLEIAGK